MVPYLAKKWTSQAIIWMSYPHAHSRLTHLQAQVSGTCEAAELVEMGEQCPA